MRCEEREGEREREVEPRRPLSHLDLVSPPPLIHSLARARPVAQDFCRDQDPTLRSLSLKQFATTLLSHCPPDLLPAYAAQAGPGGGGGGVPALVEALAAAFSAFKATVPAAGVIILDPTLTKVLLVRGLKEGASWGFPKGKLARGESDLECAVRECLEETGFDAGPAIASASDFIELHDKQQRTRLFIAPGVDEATPFAPLVRGEIGGLAWHLVGDLPADREAASLVYTTADGVRHRFFRVWPYVRPLKRWIKGYRARVKAADGAVPMVRAQEGGTGTPATGGKKGRRRNAKGSGGGSSGDDRARRAAAPAATAGHLTATTEAVPPAGGALAAWAGFDRERVVRWLQ